MRTPPLFTLSLALALLSLTTAKAEEGPQQRTITVTGEGEVNASPDLAIVSFAVETTSTLAREAVDENARKSAALAEALKKKLQDKDKISTTRYSLDPMYEQRERGSSGPPAISGYVARNEVRIELHAIGTVGALIDIATQAGANRVSDLQFTLDDRASYLHDALQRAGHEAHEQAKSVAAALGVKLKQVVSATTSSPPIVLSQRYQSVGMAMAESRAPTPVEPGEVSVQATLHVTYEIE
jgi:uncharacterized protein YggE